MTARQRIAILTVALLAGIGAAAAWNAVAGGDDDAADLDAVLDTPGTYEVPTIGTNAVLAGTTLPDVTVTDLDGNDVSTSDLLGTPTVINVWFSTCQPCKKEMPLLAAVSKEYAGRVAFIGIDPNDSAETAQEFAAKYGVEYPLYIDSNGEFTAANGIATFPSTLFVAADGTVVKQVAIELTEDTLRSSLEGLLS